MSGGGGGGFLAPILKPVLDPISSALGLNPEMPGAPKVSTPPSPTSSDPKVAKEAQDKMDAAAEEQRKAKGRASTILTDLDAPSSEGGTTSAKRTLLGA